MSLTYLKAVLATLALFSITSTALPANTESTVSYHALDISAPLTAVPTAAACEAASRDFSCPAANATNYKASDCQDFVLECGTDHLGGDLPDNPQYPGSFAGCVDACAGDEACVALVYGDGPCYLKGELVATAELPGATGARKATASLARRAAASTSLPSFFFETTLWYEPASTTESESSLSFVTTFTSLPPPPWWDEPLTATH